VVAWVLAYIYIRTSNQVFDRLVARVLDKARQIKGGRP
jgi:uncharacterized membrane protein (DUF485 family)